MSAEVVARPAASAVLVRDAPHGGIEVFMLRRAAASEFMANVYVFPGGRVDKADCSAHWLDTLSSQAVQHCCDANPDLSAADAVGHCIAAIRETFEESGVFLGTAAVPPARLLSARVALQAGAALHEVWDPAFGAPAVGDLCGWRRWITPRAQPKRYDARFFLVRMPPDQTADHDALETSACEWVPAERGVQRYGDGQLPLGPPQVKMLAELAAFPSVDALFAEALRSPRPPTPMLPEPLLENGALTLLLPGDHEYPDVALRGHTKHRARRVGDHWVLDEGAASPEPRA
jgi:8-oxo-dGTP pyrophosphatase MutT (NUDIX family)